ncbi:hypothetical protein BGX29_012209 [Mortierella sp. GBA35]|nr:hypothetical protein BGX23_007437 [Mortierella sp. AD031]KAF9105443.1 hypothetical protein BGX29_012209 [Mortierella sp. GBA35]
MDDDFDLNYSDGDQGYNETEPSRGRWEKRPARAMEDDFEDDEMQSDGRNSSHAQKQSSTTGFSSASKHLQKGRSTAGSGTGAEPRRAPVEDDGGDHDDVEDRGPTFRTETLHGVFKDVWTDPGTKAQKEALELSSEFLRLFTIEALHRTAGYQREQEDEELKDDETLVELDSLEAITPQLVMDF